MASDAARRRRVRCRRGAWRTGGRSRPPRFVQVGGRRLNDCDRLGEGAWLQFQAGFERALPFSGRLGVGFLLLGVGDGNAQIAGVLAIEGHTRALDPALLGAVADQHLGPCDPLKNAEVAAAKVQAAQEGNEESEWRSHGLAREVVRPIGGVKRNLAGFRSSLSA